MSPDFHPTFLPLVSLSWPPCKMQKALKKIMKKKVKMARVHHLKSSIPVLKPINLLATAEWLASFCVLAAVCVYFTIAESWFKLYRPRFVVCIWDFMVGLYISQALSLLTIVMSFGITVWPRWSISVSWAVMIAGFFIL